MKTFDEAIATLVELNVGGVDVSPTPAEKRQAANDRYKDIDEEIIAHPAVHDMVDQLMLRVATKDTIDFEVALVEAFANGVMIGIEMERTETGGVQL